MYIFYQLQMYRSYLDYPLIFFIIYNVQYQLLALNQLKLYDNTHSFKKDIWNAIFVSKIRTFKIVAAIIMWHLS